MPARRRQALLLACGTHDVGRDRGDLPGVEPAAEGGHAAPASGHLPYDDRPRRLQLVEVRPDGAVRMRGGDSARDEMEDRVSRELRRDRLVGRVGVRVEVGMGDADLADVPAEHRNSDPGGHLLDLEAI